MQDQKLQEHWFQFHKHSVTEDKNKYFLNTHVYCSLNMILRWPTSLGKSFSNQQRITWFWQMYGPWEVYKSNRRTIYYISKVLLNIYKALNINENFHGQKQWKQNLALQITILKKLSKIQATVLIINVDKV